MFKCAAGHVSERGERMFKRVVETRVKVYPPRAAKAEGMPKDNGGTGYKTVREITLCEEHA